MADFRVKDDFLDHPKTKKLVRLLGDRAVLCLLRLWGHATRNKWTGELTNMDTDDIEIASNWDDERGLFVQTLLKVGFLDEGQGFYILHDWEDHNGYAAKTGERKEQAQNAAAKRWEGKRANAQSANQQCSEHESVLLKDAGSNAPLPLPLPDPLPDPEPLPEPEKKTGSDEPVRQEAKPPDDCPHHAIVDLYHEILPELPRVRVWGKDQQAQLKARWREDKARQNLDWWQEYFQDVCEMDFLMGRSEKPWTGCNLAWLTGAKNMPKVLNGQYHNRGQPAGNRPQDKLVSEMTRWINRIEGEEAQND